MKISRYKILLHYPSERRTRIDSCDVIEEFAAKLRASGEAESIEVKPRGTNRWGEQLCQITWLEKPSTYVDDEDAFLCVIDEKGEERPCLYISIDSDVIIGEDKEALKKLISETMYRHARVELEKTGVEDVGPGAKIW